MDAFKIEHFEADHGQPFPGVQALTPEECGRVLSILRSRLDVSPETSALDAVTVLDERQVFVEANANADEFDLMQVLPPGVSQEGEVMLNWYRFDQIDRVALQVLARYFDDFWYPSSDDIDIFDAEMSWVVSIRHDGIVKRIKFPPG